MNFSKRSKQSEEKAHHSSSSFSPPVRNKTGNGLKSKNRKKKSSNVDATSNSSGPAKRPKLDILSVVLQESHDLFQTLVSPQFSLRFSDFHFKLLFSTLCSFLSWLSLIYRAQRSGSRNLLQKMTLCEPFYIVV